ncbi:MBL fold metallo-hydrolase [Roseibium sp.]|uniref:MBL fold metallo-hydrolase n=1 Tax=Roseibium sp. TaxID=1936156 RepID=UPI003D10A59A
MMDMKNRSETVPGENERFEELGRGCYAYSADGCTNTGVIIGDRGVLIVDGQATPALAEKVLAKVRELTDKPVKQVVLTHFHAASVLGASAFEPGEIIASDLTRRMMDTRSREEIRVSRELNPVLFEGLAGETTGIAPSMTIASSMTIDLGGMDVRLMHLGRGHTMGDLVVWVPGSSVLFAGDLVQKSAAPYCGDAHLADWPRALDRISAFRPNALMPGSGKSAIGAQAVAAAIETTRDFVVTLRDGAAACVEQSLGLKDTFQAVSDALAPHFASWADFEFHLPFNVARAYDEALGLDQPQVWTRERCADLQDALSGAGTAGQPTAEQAADAVETVEEQLTAAETDHVDDAGEAGSEERVAGLVSDSDFAASLALAPEEDTDHDGLEPEGQAQEETTLDLSAEDIIVSDGETVADGSDSQAEKILENAR